VIRLLIADDHAIVREGLKQIFSLAENIDVAGEAATGAEVLEAVYDRPYDLLLLDMTMPGINGVDLIHRIRLRESRLPILILSMHNSPQIVRRTLKAGAAGYLAKESPPETLIAAVKKVAAGGRYIDPVLAEQMAFDMEEPGTGKPHEQLSGREFQILCLLVRGKSVNEIAEELAISNKTVSTHKAHLMQKMGFKTNSDLLSYGLSHGLFA
jgi:DNA-binding NarL/FixJ family response regulator